MENNFIELGARARDHLCDFHALILSTIPTPLSSYYILNKIAYIHFLIVEPCYLSTLSPAHKESLDYSSLSHPQVLVLSQ